MAQTATQNTKENNWYVITGGPSSGKTTTINLLKEKGYITTVENARHFLDLQRLKGKTVEEIKKNHKKFQLGLLLMQMQLEKHIAPQVQVFLDRAIPDSLAYYRFFNLEVDPKLADALDAASYKKIFIMDPLPLVNDYARLENPSDQKKIHDLISEVYHSMPFPVVHVPVLPAEERVEFILKHL